MVGNQWLISCNGDGVDWFACEGGISGSSWQVLANKSGSVDSDYDLSNDDSNKILSCKISFHLGLHVGHTTVTWQGFRHT